MHLLITLVEILLLNLYSTELEIALLPTLRRANSLTIQQRRQLDAGLCAVKFWFDIFLEIDPVAYVEFAFPVFLQIGRCLTTLYRLANPRDPIWSEEVGFAAAEVTLISNRIASNLEQVATLNGSHHDENGIDEDIYSRATRVVRALQADWEAKLRAAAESLGPLPFFSTPSRNVNDVSFQDSFTSNLLDDDWFSDLILFPSD